MEQTEFLEKHVYTDMKNMNDGFDQESELYFSESDFEKVLQKAEHYGIGLFSIKTSLEGEPHATTLHDEHKKKATDPNWYKKAFKTFRMGQTGLLYSATYKVSKKLLAR